AIEPERINYYMLRANVAINKLRQVICLRHCVSDKKGIITVPDLDRTVRQNFGGLALDDPTIPNCGSPVPIIRLDDLDQVSSVSLIKIDVEGMEQKVLRGATQTIRKYRPFLYVENDRPEKSENLIRYISSLGYQIWHHLPPLWNPKNFAGRK